MRKGQKRQKRAEGAKKLPFGPFYSPLGPFTSLITLLSMNTYRFILERYRGISTRYTCPQCGRKQTFTRYIDTENNNNYLSERVGKCNRLDKCGYHYTPKQYFTDNPCERDKYLVEDGSLRPCGYHYTPKQYLTDNPWLREERNECSFVRNHRENERTRTLLLAKYNAPSQGGWWSAVSTWIATIRCGRESCG